MDENARAVAKEDRWGITPGVAVGYFSRAALIHVHDTEDEGRFKLIIERAEDKATLWTELTMFGADKLETRIKDATCAYLNAKLHNAFARCEDMATREVPAGIVESRGMFANAVNLQPRVTSDSQFVFLDVPMAEQFKKFADAYGCEVVPFSYAH